MWIKSFNGNLSTKSGTYDANFLFKEDKFYVMDNHLSATWCWLQELDLKKKYNYFHIDRHYDLLDNKPDFRQYLSTRKIDLTSLDFEEYLKLPDEELGMMPTNNRPYPLFRFDNYLPFFNRANPKVLAKRYFATHEDGTIPQDFKIDYRPQIYEVFENINYWLSDKTINEGSAGWVFNLDIDYFFQGRTDEFQFLTDEYIISICEEIKQSLEQIKVITIAMSPEFCGGWKESYRITKIITNFFKLDFSLPFP